ncbi:S-adenosyl-L-methionine-dependent methyltransferase [Stachybotrys elegans]|uniref:S-adenosyl-L-methionine-dependent methyltransferase n=1 Tax=Stachybotrys elegans TaxID=80388 RepID=A0A8K0SKI7_9HYPO|nr:S-adenosyl-L-methionine-dependent methyltransferase [Stachybotrys elegans]
MDALALANQLEAISANPETITALSDDNTRRRLCEAAMKLSLALEAGGDSIHRITNAPLELALSRVGAQCGLWKTLAQDDASASFTHQQLAAQTNVDPVLMKRLLRYYQSKGMVKQTGPDSYESSNVTKALATPGGAGGIGYFAEMVYPALMGIPEFLRKTNHANPTNPDYCPWHVGHKTDESPFAYLGKRPEMMEFFLPWMAGQRDGMPAFLDVFDFEKEVGMGTDPSVPVFVDVGGAIGHQCVLFKERYPSCAGRIVLQEQAHVIDQVKAAPLPGFDGIETQSYDFWGPEPLHGARVYYLRNVLHDWPDHKVKEILQNIKAGMSEDSVILIDEMVLPDEGTPWRAAGLDMDMLACLAASERTSEEWNKVIDDAGLVLVKSVQYTVQCNDCILICKRK